MKSFCSLSRFYIKYVRTLGHLILYSALLEFVQRYYAIINSNVKVSLRRTYTLSVYSVSSELSIMYTICRDLISCSRSNLTKQQYNMQICTLEALHSGRKLKCFVNARQLPSVFLEQHLGELRNLIFTAYSLPSSIIAIIISSTIVNQVSMHISMCNGSISPYFEYFNILLLTGQVIPCRYRGVLFFFKLQIGNIETGHEANASVKVQKSFPLRTNY